MAKNRSKEGTGILAEFFDDLTHLQIDTILKSGMISAEPPERVEELLFELHQGYVEKLGLIISRNELQYEFKKDECLSFKAWPIASRASRTI